MSLPSIRCVNSYELVGGIEQPFEYVTVELSKKALKTVAPELVGNDKGSGILAGRNKIRISAVGICNNMTVTKCKMTKDTFTITAYCDAEVLTGYKVSVSLTGSPLNIIRDILTSGTYGVNFEEGVSFIHNVSDKAYNMAIDGNTNAWTALQMCAMVLGAKMFFSGDKAYLINCISGNSYIQDISSIELDTKDKTNFMYGRVVEDISLGDEGTSTITNCVKVLCSGQNRGSYYFEDKDSIKAYNRHEHADITICDADDSDDDAKMCEDFARTYVDYRKCPQQSIEFTVDELSEDDNNGLPKWTQFFPPITRVGKIIDSKDDVTISAVTLNGVPQKQTLMMTGYTRHYPKGTTRYEFGVISNVDLAESTSQIIAAQGTK